MNAKPIPNEEQIESLLSSIQPRPSERYDRRMANTPWTEIPQTFHAKRLTNPRFRIALAAALAVLLVFMILLTTPQGLAWAQSTFRFFTRTVSNTLPNPNPTAEIFMVDVTPGVSSAPEPTPTANGQMLPLFSDECGSWSNPTCTVEQIRGMVNFEVKELARIPDGMRLLGATGGPDEVWIHYQRDDLMGGILLSQGPWTDDLAKAWKVALTATVESVPIGNTIGEYVKGSWFMSAVDAVATWDPTDGQTLRWREKDMFYTMMVTGSPEDQGQPLDKNGMAALAAGPTTQPVVVAPDTTRLKTAQEAEALAGFDVIQPDPLPDGYTFKYASYVPETGSVCLYFMNSSDEFWPSLRIVEGTTRPFPKLKDIFNPGPDELKDGAYVITDSLSIGGAADEHSLYVFGWINENPYCDNTRESQALVVQMADFWFIIFARQDIGQGFLTKLEMAKLAENITGVHTISEYLLDPERLPSVEAAEQLAGLKMKTPNRLPAVIGFDYASFLQDGRGKWITLHYSNFTISAGFGITDTFERMDEQSHGSYKKVWVNGLPARYMQGCGTDQGWDWNCFGTLSLTWFEDGVEYSIWAAVGDLNEETAIAIAESVR